MFLASYGKLKPQIMMAYSHYRFRIVIQPLKPSSLGRSGTWDPLADLIRVIETLKVMGSKIKVLFVMTKDTSGIKFLNNLLKLQKQYTNLQWSDSLTEIEAFCAMVPK
jgi:hypothetical protein